ncbi:MULTISPECIES: DUF1566 domain-containing protein [unclassified Bacteroides]|uniref:DUF1566 domain-containing protein n=1 Tax=unclassified Bacteroides TaxID=2646097 RepID=UPI0004E1CC16|nr:MULTISPECIES: DUF1566 domain-containing protein [unclassified Bacteroides]
MIFRLKPFFGALLMLCAVAFTSCHDDEGWDCPYKITVTMPVYENAASSDPTILSGTLSGGEQVCVLDLTTSINRSILTNDGNGEFSGRLYGGYENDRMALFYPASAVNAYTSDTLTQTLSAMEQLGTAKDLHKYMYAWAKDTLNVTYTEQTAYSARKLGAITGVVKWMFTTDGVTPIKDIVSVVASSEIGTMYSKRVFRMSTGGFSSSTEGSVSMTNADGVTGTIYMSMFPATFVQLHFTVMTKNGDRYEAIQPEVTTYEAGKVYDTEVFTCQPIAKAKVGDYYYSDGSTSSVLNADRTCVGIVYALTNANGEIDQNLTESSSGCVVAIKDLNNSTLYRWSAKVENTSIADYTTVDGTKNTAFLPFYKGQAGVYYSTENKLEISDASNIALWPKQGCISDFAGDDHAQYFTSSTYYAAGYNSRNDGLASLNWYLPSMGELLMVYLQEKNGVISHAKQSPYINLSDQSYWSSSEYDDSHAWAFSYTSANIFACYKTSTHNVRPVLKF